MTPQFQEFYAVKKEQPMSAVTTMEALVAHPIDAEIQVTSSRPVGTKVFKRVVGGFTDGTVVVPDLHFAGAVSAGVVVSLSGLPPGPGDWWILSDRTTWRVLLRIDPSDDGRWRMAQFDTSRETPLIEWCWAYQMADDYGWSRLSSVDRSPWMAHVYRLVAEREASTDHRTTVTINGQSWLTHTATEAQQLMGDDFVVEATEEGSLITWTRQVEVIKRGVGCTCHQVTPADLDRYLPANRDSFRFDVACAD